MYLQKIDIQGFKSFAKKTSLTFPKETVKNKGITAIVGPNGSGKSNISDAVRWVLGEQSTKTLRAKKSEDVIFSGSDKKARLGFAEVSLYLNNESGRVPIEYSEIVITRRLYRSGESEYLLNKNRVRLQDLQILLAKGSIGQRTYSVIGQGMIDYFLIAPPHERKEFFDEAAGVKEYQIKRNQSLNKLISAHGNLTKADLLLQEIDPRLKSLTRQMHRLEKREALQATLKNLQQDYFGSIKNKLEEKETKINKELKKLQGDCQIDEQKLKSIVENLQNFTEEESRNEIFDELKNSYNKLIGEKNLLLQKQAVNKGSKEIEYKKIGKINIVWLEKKSDELKKEKEHLAFNFNTVKFSLAKLKEKANNIYQNKKNLDAKKIEISKKLESLQLSLLPKEINSRQLREDLQSIHNEYKILINRLQNINDVSELGELKSEAGKILEKLTLALSKISEEKEEKKEELLILKNKLNNIISEKERIVLEHNNMMIELNAKQERENVLKESLDKIAVEEKNITEELAKAKSKPGTNKEILAKLEQENSKIEENLKTLNERIDDISRKISEFNKKEEEKKENLFKLQREYQEKQQVISRLTTEINNFKINLAKIETKKEDLEIEIKNEEINLTENFNLLETPEELLPQINKIKNQLEIIGGIDPETKKEYSETKERFDFLGEQVGDLKSAIASLEKVINELDGTIKVKFEEAFSAINKEFQRYFKILFNGGSAKLLKIEEEEKIKKENTGETGQESQQEEQPEQEENMEEAKNPLKKYKQKVIFGIEIQATPPGKKVANINMLSGGERALTAIALICAIISNNPAPFIFLDEVDAALDEANSYKLAGILDDLSHKSQFIVITHNRATMNKAELLYGVTMGDDGISKLLSIKFEDAAKTVRK